MSNISPLMAATLSLTFVTFWSALDWNSRVSSRNSRGKRNVWFSGSGMADLSLTAGNDKHCA